MRIWDILQNTKIQQNYKCRASLTSLIEEIGLSSYANSESVSLKDQINIKDLSSYIKQGNSIIFGMKVQTKLASSQVGGKYGLKFYCTFKNDATG